MVIFIIMNFGYVGWFNFFDNLKKLFWSLVMIKFDWQLIVQVMLYLQGFCIVEVFVNKIVLFFKLCDEQLFF